RRQCGGYALGGFSMPRRPTGPSMKAAVALAVLLAVTAARVIYALGSQGAVVCLDDTGREKWRKDLVKEFGGRVNPVTGSGLGWGYSWSPLVAGDLVVLAPGGDGGLLLALDKTTGATVWRSKAVADDCTYSSPILAEFGGVPQ